MMPLAWRVRLLFPSDGRCAYLCHVKKKKKETVTCRAPMCPVHVYISMSMYIYSEVQDMLCVSGVLAT